MNKRIRTIVFTISATISGCGIQDSPIQSALKEMWAEKADCSGRSFRITGDAPKLKLQLYLDGKESESFDLDIFKELSETTAKMGLNLAETNLIFDLSVQDDRVILSKPYFSPLPSEAFWTYVEETSGKNRDEFKSNLERKFDVPTYYRCNG